MHQYEKERIVLQMYINENMTIKQIADDMNFSERYIKKIIHDSGCIKEKTHKKDDKHIKIDGKMYTKLSKKELIKLLTSDSK